MFWFHRKRNCWETTCWLAKVPEAELQGQFHEKVFVMLLWEVNTLLSADTIKLNESTSKFDIYFMMYT